MSSDTSSKETTKPTVFYTKKSKKDHSRDRDNKNRSGKPPHKKGGYQNKDKPFYSGADKSFDKSKSKPENRIESFKPRKRHSDTDIASSPWQNKIRHVEQKPSFNDSHNDEAKSAMLRRQSKDETFIYGENSCKAVFRARKDAIIKAFFTEQLAPIFKDTISYLVEHRLGYDVISNEEMAKLAGTAHHGGVCFIVRKRTSVSVIDYIEMQNRSRDCVLAVHDVENPHNLGGLARSAAFFKVNGMMLRQPNILDNGAALRVAEGGGEVLTPIRADDFMTSLSLFKQHGYQIVALLPCKIKAVTTAKELSVLETGKKVVFIIFQQVNLKLVEFADDVVYLPGSDIMPSLNISVATGILLSHWKNV